MYARHGFQLSYPWCQENPTIHGIRSSSPGLNTKDWTAAQYSKDLMFSKSKFSMCFGSQGLRVWRKREEVPNPCCSRLIVKFPQSVMVCGLRSSAGYGPLYFSGSRWMQTSTRKFKSISCVLLLTNAALWRFPFPGLGNCTQFQSYQYLVSGRFQLPVPGFRIWYPQAVFRQKEPQLSIECYTCSYFSCSCFFNISRNLFVSVVKFKFSEILYLGSHLSVTIKLKEINTWNI